MWALGWLVCIGEASSPAGFLLSLRIGESWEGQSLPSQQGPECQSTKNTENKNRYLIQVNRYLIQVYSGEGGWLK